MMINTHGIITKIKDYDFMVLWIYLFFPWKKLHNFIMETKITIFFDFVSQCAIIASLYLPKRSMHSPWSIVLNIMNPIYTCYQKDNETIQKWLQFFEKMTSLEKGNMEHVTVFHIEKWEISLHGIQVKNTSRKNQYLPICANCDKKKKSNRLAYKEYL